MNIIILKILVDLFGLSCNMTYVCIVNENRYTYSLITLNTLFYEPVKMDFR